MSDEKQRAALREAIEKWIASGARTYEPAIARLAHLGGFPPDLAVYDDAIARAGQPPIARLYMERHLVLCMLEQRPDHQIADLERAYEVATANDERSAARGVLAQHYASLGELDKAIALMYEAIELGSGSPVGDEFNRSTLARWLEKRGDKAAALAIHADLASTATTAERATANLANVFKMQLEAGDRAAAEATCAQMTATTYETAEAWFDLLWDETDPARIERAIAAIVRCWQDPLARIVIQSRTRSAWSSREHLLAQLDAALFPLADAGLAESREIEDRLLAEPEGHLVLADELTRRGDPRGELIVVQQTLERAPAEQALVLREQAILNENSLRLLGPLDEYKARWRHGYVSHAQLHVMSPEALGHVALVGTHPSTRFLQELTIKALTDVTEVLLDAPAGLRRITKLVLAVKIWELTDERRAALKAALPNIEFA